MSTLIFSSQISKKPLHYTSQSTRVQPRILTSRDKLVLAYLFTISATKTAGEAARITYSERVYKTCSETVR